MLGRKTVQLKESLVAEKQKNDQENEEMQAETVNHCNYTYVRTFLCMHLVLCVRMYVHYTSLNGIHTCCYTYVRMYTLDLFIYSLSLLYISFVLVLCRHRSIKKYWPKKQKCNKRKCM